MIILGTRMHSSVMRTARLSTISQHALDGVCVSQHALGRGCLPRGMSFKGWMGECLPSGLSALVCVADTPMDAQTFPGERGTLPCDLSKASCLVTLCSDSLDGSETNSIH